MHLPKHSIGMGDRFARQGTAQLDAVLRAVEQGVDLAPVWNKSHREHMIVGTRPADVRAEAMRAVGARGWTAPYFVDADHISLKTVDSFLESSDFFTLDVADWIGASVDDEHIERFVKRYRKYLGNLDVEGLDDALDVREQGIAAVARKYLAAVKEAGRIYRRIEEAKGPGAFITEVSMDETDSPQTPVELLFILAAIAGARIPIQTIAPRFSGRFNKGVDYVGDMRQFAREFDQSLAVIAFAVREFGLSGNLKLSVHSGSDKFSLYGPMRRALRKYDAGVHLKTAGTTWLEELTGLAEAGGDGLDIAKEIYAQAVRRFEELCAPYASVIDIDRAALPSPEEVRSWDEAAFAAALRHAPACPAYNANVRQLLHVAYRVAAEMGSRFTLALEKHAETIARNVTSNLYDRHIQPLFC